MAAPPDDKFVGGDEEADAILAQFSGPESVVATGEEYVDPLFEATEPGSDADDVDSDSD